MSSRCRHLQVRRPCFILIETYSCRLKLTFFRAQISKSRLVRKNAIALAYYGSCKILQGQRSLGPCCLLPQGAQPWTLPPPTPGSAALDPAASYPRERSLGPCHPLAPGTSKPEEGWSGQPKYCFKYITLCQPCSSL